MKKKIVAAICAAALALAMPVAAFAGTYTQDSSVVTNKNTSIVTYNVSKVSGTKADLKNLVVIGNKDLVKELVVDPTSENAVFIGGSNIIAAQSFVIDAISANNVKVGLINKDGQLRDDAIAGTIEFHWDDLVSTLPATIDHNNLYTSVYAKHSGDNNVEVLEANAKGYKAGFKMDRCSIVTAGLSNGKVIYDPAMGVTAADGNTTGDLEKAAADGTKSPKTGDVA